MTTSGNIMCIVVVGLMGWQVTAGGSGAGAIFLFAGLRLMKAWLILLTVVMPENTTRSYKLFIFSIMSLRLTWGWYQITAD